MVQSKSDVTRPFASFNNNPRKLLSIVEFIYYFLYLFYFTLLSIIIIKSNMIKRNYYNNNKVNARNWCTIKPAEKVKLSIFMTPNIGLSN